MVDVKKEFDEGMATKYTKRSASTRKSPYRTVVIQVVKNGE